MSDDERLPVAVARAAVPTITVARDHASRGAREMVYVDTTGRGVSPVRAWAPLVAVTAGGLGLSAIGFLPIWFPFFLGGILVWQLVPMRRGMRGNALALNGRLDEAEHTLRPLARNPLLHPAYRNAARATLAWIESQRGDHEAALAWAERGSRLGWPRLSVAFCRTARVRALVNLGRVGEARAYFDRHLAQVPSGDLLRHHQWTAELYVALGEGGHALGEDELHRRAREALGVTSARALLALLAWAHHAAGDVDQAWHLLREALEREDAERAENSLPLLHAWMTKHEALARAAAPDEGELGL